MDDVYLPWTICGRQLHWSEGVLLVAVGISLGCLALWGSGLRIRATLYSLVLIVLSILSLWMVWGVAQVKSFAKLASALESEQGRIQTVTEGLREQNGRVHEATQRTRAQVAQVARDLGLLEGGLEDLDAAQRGLRSFAETMAEHQHEQHILNAAQKEKILREHEIHRDERARQCRDRIIEWFDSAADKQVFVNTPQQHRDLLEVLEVSCRGPLRPTTRVCLCRPFMAPIEVRLTASVFTQLLLACPAVFMPESTSTLPHDPTTPILKTVSLRLFYDSGDGFNPL